MKDVRCSLRRPLRPPRPTMLAALFILAIPARGSPQDETRPPHIREAFQRRIESVEPRAGPPGTSVRVASEEMPMITPIWVGVGAVRTGFEAFHQLMTDMDGTFAVQMEIPAWAQWDRVHTFIAFDLYFRPIALSDVFHVTDEAGRVQRRGTVTEAYPGCLSLEDLDGVGYALEGVTPGQLRAGDDVVVEGAIVLEGRCNRPYTIGVTRVERREEGG